MVKIKIHGDIINSQATDLADMGYATLASLVKKLEEAEGKDIEVGIASDGGDVDTGFAMYSALRRYADENNAKVTTIMDGSCSSIATVVFLAGDRRIVSRFIEPFVHNAWTMVAGDAGELVRVAADLDRYNDRLAKFYSDHTKLTFEEAKDLMGKDTYLTPEQALAIRFATEIEKISTPKALKRFVNQNKNPHTVTDMKKNEKFLASLKKLFLNEVDDSALEVYTAESELIVFPELEDGDTPSEGDKATINGEPAEGSYTLQSGETYVFEGGVLIEIKPAEDEDQDDSAAEIEALKTENANLKKRLEAQAKKISANASKIDELTKNWEGLKALVSEVSVEEKENQRKFSAGKPPKEAKGLSGAVNRLKKTK